MKKAKIVQKRNLIVLGRTGVGKSTVVNQILGKNVLQVSSITRERRTSEEETEIETRNDEGNVAYKIKIIDTVGEFNERDKVDKRSEEVVDEIQDYLSRKAPEGVNLFLFVMRKDDFSEEEKEAFGNIISRFNRKVKQLSALIITGCEGIDRTDRKQIIFEIRNGETTELLADFMGREIYLVGFPSVDDDLKPSLREEYEKGTKNDTEELRSVVLSCGLMTLPQDVIKPKSSRGCSIS